MFLVIHGDKLIYECNFLKPEKLQSYFSIHASLDSVDNEIARRRDFYLGQIKNEELPIFCYVNAVGLKLILFLGHIGKKEFDKKSDTMIRDFLIEANKQLTNVLMNPLYKERELIRSLPFDEKIIQLGKENLRPVLIETRKK